MEDTFDKQKMLDLLIDPDVSIILAELENGEKNSAHIAKKLRISEDEIKNRLSYAIEHEFVIIKQNGKSEVISVDKDKLNKIMESDETFDGIVSGLTELDQFLN